MAVCGRNRTDIDRVVGRLKATGSRAAGFVLEVTSTDTVQTGVDAILDHFGKIDILLNNAGTNYRVPVLEFPEEEWDRVINTNLKGYYLVAKAVVPQMIEHGYGKVINMSSILGSNWNYQPACLCVGKRWRRSNDQNNGVGVGQIGCACQCHRSDLF